ncbi:hypothetical protein FGO68_gene9629 [Halteria grandinella]|uniref:Uncharacterized protein n=1 Tax=Halteria grandinella TaxID=5974 RepID=A0A8J8NKS8_HALGN|nr:hypothetical protein FGO68_gene9629 [Halteria grandinella]
MANNSTKRGKVLSANQDSFLTTDENDGQPQVLTISSHPSKNLEQTRFTLRNAQGISRKSTGDGLFKVILLGDSKVGKSSIVMRLVDEQFSLEHQPTMGFDFSFKRLALDSKKLVTLQVFDTAGLDRYDSLASSYFKGAQGFVIVCDMSQAQSFTNIATWVEQIHKNTDTATPTIMVLVNKRDLTTIKKGAITLSMMEDFQREHTDVLFYEVSARTGYNVEDAFKDLAQKLFDKGLNKHSSGFRLTANGSIKRGPNSQQSGMIGGVPSLGTSVIQSDPRMENPGDTACCGGGIFIDENGERQRRKGCAC